MIVFLLFGLVLLATAIALIARGVIAARLRTVDTLGQIGRYGFTGTPDLQPNDGLRGLIDGAASSIGLFLSEHLNLANEERLRKTLVSAGMYNT